MKKIWLSILCCMLLLCGCSSSPKEPGKVQEIGIEDAFDKMDKKDTFLLLITRDKCYYCQLMHKMLNDTIETHPTVIYNAKMDDSTDESLQKDFKQLKTRLKDPGRTPHAYYIKKGKVEQEFVGFDEEEPMAFWDWVKKYDLEDLK